MVSESRMDNIYLQHQRLKGYVASRPFKTLLTAVLKNRIYETCTVFSRLTFVLLLFPKQKVTGLPILFKVC